jgi:HEAT repeat protein
MDIEKRKLVWDFASKKLSEHEFALRYGVDFRLDQGRLLRELDEALTEQSPDSVEAAVVLGSYFGWPSSADLPLCKLLEEEWHFKHEDIAHVLQQLRPPCAVEPLYRTVSKNYEYLAYDGGAALARKCIYALHDIDTPDAKERLAALSNSDVEHVRTYARHALSSFKP